MITKSTANTNLRTGFIKRSIARLIQFYIITLILYSTHVTSEIISETLPNNIVATAEYKSGDPNKPAVIVLHGFLQTYTFLATHNIIEGLSDLDFTVVGPNLSLGVPARKRSLQCEAVHQHTLNDDLDEINFWVRWLQNKGHKKVIFVGHSWGSQHALAYLSSQRDTSNIVGLVAISLVPSEENSVLMSRQLEQALTKQLASNATLHKFVLGFCQKYTSTTQGYLSYAEWNDKKLLSALADITRNGKPVFTILGSADKRLRKMWIKDLTNAGSTISVVKDANHFFSSAYEFDLIDELDVVLKTFVLAND